MAVKRPTKVFETNPELEFEFYLADRLGMTVARMRDEMSADEFMRWDIFHARKAQRMELAALKAKG